MNLLIMYDLIPEDFDRALYGSVGKAGRKIKRPVHTNLTFRADPFINAFIFMDQSEKLGGD